MEENQAKLRLQMELDSKDSEIETLQMKIASLNSETASMSSIENDDGEDSVLSEHGTMRLEGWLNVPNKQNIKRHGWKKQYVVVSSKKIIFYNSENDKLNADPVLILDLNKVFHVRSVTQGDVIRANAKDIPRIFQVFFLPSVVFVIFRGDSFRLSVYFLQSPQINAFVRSYFTPAKVKRDDPATRETHYCPEWIYRSLPTNLALSR